MNQGFHLPLPWKTMGPPPNETLTINQEYLAHNPIVHPQPVCKVVRLPGAGLKAEVGGIRHLWREGSPCTTCHSPLHKLPKPTLKVYNIKELNRGALRIAAVGPGARAWGRCIASHSRR